MIKGSSVLDQSADVRGGQNMMFEKCLKSIRMKSAFFITTLLTFCFLKAGLSFGDGLIPPTRTLGDGEKHWGRLTVFSEPPGLDVYLDDKKVGVTPLWLGRVETGIYALRIEDHEAQIHLEQGIGIKAGLFKGAFITMEDKEPEVLPAPGPEEKPKPRRAEEKPAPEERKEDLTRWELFINGSLPFF